MKAITIRNLPTDLARIRQKAKAEGTSLNRVVINLLRKRLAAITSGHGPARYHDLDEFAGSWTKEEADEFDKHLASQRTIDPELWARSHHQKLNRFPLR